MGSKLALAAILTGALGGRALAQPTPPTAPPKAPPSAPPKAPPSAPPKATPATPPKSPGAPAVPAAPDNAKQGADLYNAGDYAGAVAPLQRAVEADPNNFEVHFMLAEALRQSGNCADALHHYEQLESTAPPDRADALKSAKAECAMKIAPPPPAPAPPPPPPPPTIVYRDGPINRGTALMLIGSGAGLAGGLWLALAAWEDKSDASAAARIEDHDHISGRADALFIGALVSAGAGVALGALAMYRLKQSDEGTQVTVSPTKGGAAFVLGRTW